MSKTNAPAVINSRQAFVSNLPSPRDAGAALHRFAGPEMAVWHAVHRTGLVLQRAFFTEEGRKLVREGAEDGKAAIEGVGKAVEHAAGVARQAHKYGKGLERIAVYGEHVKQIAQDVMRVKVDYKAAEIAAAAGNNAAASMQAFLKPPLLEAEAALQRESRVLIDYYRLADHAGAGLSGKVAKLALEGEKMLGKSGLGRGIAEAKKLWMHSGLEESMLTAGALIEASKTWDEAKGVSRRGRAVKAALGGVAQAGFDKYMPELGALDFGIKMVGKAVGAKNEDVENFTFSKWAEGTVTTYFQLGRAILHGDSAPLSELHRANMKGENGRVLQGYAMIGEKISNSAAMDYLMDGAINISNAASKGYTRSLAWWGSQHH